MNENKTHRESSKRKGTKTIPITETLEKQFDTLFKENIDEEAEKDIEKTFVRRSPRLVNKPVQHYALLSTINPPKTFYDIRKRHDGKHWFEAYKREISSLETLGEMRVMMKKDDKGLILPLLELFSTKVDTVTKEFRYKVRIVARGDLQSDPGDTYAPVAGVEVIRLFFFLMFHLEFKLMQVDVSNAFLYGRTEKMKYYHLPLGHSKQREEKHVWSSQKSLYGSK